MLLGITYAPTGLVDVYPTIVYIDTDNTLTEVTTAGYLNENNFGGLGNQIVDGAMCLTTNTPYKSTWLIANVAANGQITLSEEINTGNVTLPVVSGDFAVFDGTTGKIKDAGYLPTDAAKTKVVMANAAVVAGYIACFTDTSGTIDDGAATAINPGNIQAGLSGTAGAVIAYPGTASKGSLILTATDNTGNTSVSITNAAHGQATVYSIPDVGASTGKFTVVTGALVDGVLMKASGTAGKLASAGYNIKSAVTASYAGGGTSNAFTATGLTATSIVTATIKTSTNAVAIAKAVPGTDTLTITFTADPGASTTVQWIATSVAVA